MKNLTENQQLIVETLVAEFTNINESRNFQKTKSNPLLAYCDEVYKIRNAEESERNIIIAQNNAISFSRLDKMKSDYDYLVDLLEEVDADIMIEKRNFDILIYVENIVLFINYKRTRLYETKFMYHSDVIAFSENILLEFKGKKYTTILDVIQSEDFSNSFKGLINRAIK
jgi:hypothetical protein